MPCESWMFVRATRPLMPQTSINRNCLYLSRMLHLHYHVSEIGIIWIVPFLEGVTVFELRIFSFQDLLKMVVQCCDLHYDLLDDSRNAYKSTSIITAYMLGSGFSWNELFNGLPKLLHSTTRTSRCSKTDRSVAKKNDTVSKRR
jgi:hypothetical protein